MAIITRPTSIMAVDNKEEKGQALFEFIIFLPLLLALFTLLITVSSAINGSINQQKITRAYFYNILKGNSQFPRLNTLYTLRDNEAKITASGMFAIGWMNKKDSSGSPLASCYKLNTLVSGDNKDKCEDPTNGTNNSKFVRVFTVYGVCGAHYSLSPDDDFFIHDRQMPAGISASCSISN